MLVFREHIQNTQQNPSGLINERESGNLFIPTAMLLVDDRERAEEHIQSSVQEGKVYRKNEDDRFVDQHKPRSSQGYFELYPKR